jgi:hypothetical protein
VFSSKFGFAFTPTLLNPSQSVAAVARNSESAQVVHAR